MKQVLAIIAIIIVCATAARGQVEPTATGPARPTANFGYTLRDSMNVNWGAGLGVWSTNTVSGQVDYSNGKPKHPLRVLYSGGYAFHLSGSSFGTGYFQNMLVSQAFSHHSWRWGLSDRIAYLPQAPTTGFSGLPGTGEPIGGGGGSTTPPDLTVLTLNTHSITNTISASGGIFIGKSTTIDFGGGYYTLRFLNAAGYDTDSINYSAGFGQKITPRSSITGQFNGSKFSYPGYTLSFINNNLLIGYQRTWNRKLSTHVQVGPSFVISSDTSVFPSSTRISITANANYHYRYESMGANYFHGTNGGSGIFYGSEFDSVSAQYSRTFERKISTGVEMGFNHTTALSGSGSNSTTGTGTGTGTTPTGVTPIYGTTSGLFFGAQAARRFGKHISTSASYSATSQSLGSNLPGNVINGLLQGFTVSVGYSPRVQPLGQ